MSNNQNNSQKDTQNNNESIDKALESLENTTDSASENDVDVEVVKGDTVIYEDGDFEDFNAEQNLDSNTDASGEDSSEKETDSQEAGSEKDSSSTDKYTAAIANLYQWATKLKDDFLAEKTKNAGAAKESDSSEDGTSNNDDSKKENLEKEDKHSGSVANIYQWAAQLKEDFSFEPAHMAHDVSDKALAIMLNKLLSSVELELATFNKKVEESELPVANVKEERSKIMAKKEKYQGMIDLLQGE